ncbi:DsbA family protein [Qipengyuania sp. 1NDW9]|uniref:DsbA family protein n=1 Tax=Qipengyuania TaxID=1855416 RepID=UPI001C8800F4|nr:MULTISPECIES: DsbA family protein [Qipengyuania]MBX7491767.1 DsbA family protein [Qipengyuania xiapuensis]MBY6127420.1 DsbA family protein [Qipengyuania aquimaris]
MKHLLTVVIAVLGGFAGAAIWSLTGVGNSMTRDYLIENPEILPEMARAYQAQEAENRLASVGDEVREPFPGAILGNPNGSRTLVKFTDYACGYCRASVADVDRLIAEDPELRVVIREWPIFQGSEAASRMALAAANQGKFDAFYHAMFASGPPTAESIAAAARSAGMDMEAAQAFGSSDAATAELARNEAYARQLGFTGTPSWIAGNAAFEGAVGFAELNAAVNNEAS